MHAVAFHNLSVLVIGTGHTQNEEIAGIALPFIFVVLADGPSRVKGNGFSCRSLFYELTSVISLEEAVSQINQERLLNLWLAGIGVGLFKSRNTCTWTFHVRAIMSFCEKAAQLLLKFS